MTALDLIAAVEENGCYIVQLGDLAPKSYKTDNFVNFPLSKPLHSLFVHYLKYRTRFLNQCGVAADQKHRVLLPLILGYSEGEVGELETKNCVNLMKEYHGMDVPPLGEWRKLNATLTEEAKANHSILHQHSASTATDSYVAKDHHLAEWTENFNKLKSKQQEKGLLLSEDSGVDPGAEGMDELDVLKEGMVGIKKKTISEQLYMQRTLAKSTSRKRTQSKLELLKALFSLSHPKITMTFLTDFSAKGRTAAVLLRILSHEGLFRAVRDEFEGRTEVELMHQLRFWVPRMAEKLDPEGTIFQRHQKVIIL